MGRLVVKDAIMMGASLVVMADSVESLPAEVESSDSRGHTSVGKSHPFCMDKSREFGKEDPVMSEIEHCKNLVLGSGESGKDIAWTLAKGGERTGLPTFWWRPGARQTRKESVLTKRGSNWIAGDTSK